MYPLILCMYVKGMLRMCIWKFDDEIFFFDKGYLHLCPRMDFLPTLHISDSLYANYENVFIELDS